MDEAEWELERFLWVPQYTEKAMNGFLFPVHCSMVQEIRDSKLGGLLPDDFVSMWCGVALVVSPNVSLAVT